MNILLDTNILTRLSDPTSPQYPAVTASISLLNQRDHFPCIVPQNLYEYYVVCSRPLDQSGLAIDLAKLRSDLAGLKSLFRFLPDLPEVLTHWENLIHEYDIRGKTAHDARLIAAMQCHGLTHLLTFNTAHFTRYRSITTLNPQTLATGQLPAHL